MKYILAAVFLISTALAYPLADQEEIKPDVPLVITDYSSISKSEPSVEIPAKVQQDEIKDISHESHSTNQQDSSESNESASVESGEKLQENPQTLEEVIAPKLEELEKPLLDEIQSKEQPQLISEPLPEKPLVLPEPVQQNLEELKPEEQKLEEPQLKTIAIPLAESGEIPQEKPIEATIVEKLPEPDVASNEAIPESKIALSEIDKVIPQESAPIPVSNPILAEIPEQLLKQEEPLVEETPLVIPVADKEPLLENKLEEEKPLENQVEQKSLPEEPKAENSVVSDEKFPEVAPAELLPAPVEEVKVALPEPQPEIVLESKTAPLEIVEAPVAPVVPIEENVPAKTLPQENLQTSLPAEPEKIAELPALKTPEDLPALEKEAELPQPEIKIDEPIEKPIAIELPVQSSEESLKQTPESEEVSASVEKLPEPSPSS